MFAHAFREGRADLLIWIRAHIVTTAVGLLTAFLGMPAYWIWTGGTAAALRDQLAQVVSYSLIGPALLVLLAYIYFCLRAPMKLYAKQIAELRDLRVQLGRSIDDLEGATGQNRLWRWLRRFGPLAAIMVLLMISGFLFYALGYIARAYNITHLVNKAYADETRLMMLLNKAMSEDAVKLCDEERLNNTHCGSIRRTNKALEYGSYKLMHIPQGVAIIVQPDTRHGSAPSNILGPKP